MDAFWRNVDRRGPDECWPWRRGCDRDGYGRLRRDRVDLRAHRVALETAVGPIPVGMSVCHRCDNPPCCNPAHLFVGTNRDNVLDMVGKGRNAFRLPDNAGERNPAAHLSEDQVLAIHAMADSLTQAEIGRAVGITQSTVSKILRGDLWPDLTGVGRGD